MLAALARGEIDWARACVFVDELAGLSDADAADIAGSLLDQAGGWTTGQLRAALRRAVLAFDPDAARRRREAARKDAEVQVWEEPSGNAALAGRELPPADVLAADARLTALARWLKGHGAAGTIAQLRAAAYLALLGRPVSSLLPGARNGSGNPTSAGRSVDADTRGGGEAGTVEAGTSVEADADSDTTSGSWPQLAGTINLTLPMTTWAGLAKTPGEVAGHGPADAVTCTELAKMTGGAARWCLTLTGPGGRAVAHACARRPPPPGSGVITWATDLGDKLCRLETGTCSHDRQSGRYIPPPRLAHLIRVRQRTCSFPGCRRAALRCDIDHTVPFDRGGITCECNLAPLCRRHHRAKQAPRWLLEQTQPGLMTWNLPHGRAYQTTGDPHPVEGRRSAACGTGRQRGRHPKPPRRRRVAGAQSCRSCPPPSRRRPQAHVPDQMVLCGPVRIKGRAPQARNAPSPHLRCARLTGPFRSPMVRLTFACGTKMGDGV